VNLSELPSTDAHRLAFYSSLLNRSMIIRDLLRISQLASAPTALSQPSNLFNGSQ